MSTLLFYYQYVVMSVNWVVVKIRLIFIYISMVYLFSYKSRYQTIIEVIEAVYTSLIQLFLFLQLLYKLVLLCTDALPFVRLLSLQDNVFLKYKNNKLTK